MIIPTNEEKQAVWAAYNAGKPTRVPLTWGVNNRAWILDPALNTEGITFEQHFNDPQSTLTVYARFEEHCAEYYSQSSDLVDTLPDVWTCYADLQSCGDPLFFGGEITYTPGQMPAVEPFMSLDDIDGFLARDFASDPAANPIIRRQLRYREELEKAAKDFSYRGRRARIAHYLPYYDGPLTTCMSLFGADILLFMAEEPEKAKRLFQKISRDFHARNCFLRRYAGLPETTDGTGWTDDSIQLISTDTYRALLLDAHKWYVEATTGGNPEAQVLCHLCGDATRHFKTIADNIRTTSFDTGFPVDFGALRRELGPGITILGGPNVALLQSGTPQQCFEETRRILQSGICEGGRFTLREGNNLPPRCPLENLQAVYAACLECGWLPR